MPITSFAACNVDVDDADLRQLARGMQEHIKSINEIAKGYKGIDANEGMWLYSLSQNIHQVQVEIFHLRDLAYLRNSISGNENQKILREVIKDSMAKVSESASISKDNLLGSSAMTTNQAVSSEIAQIINILNNAINLGNTCQSGK